MTLDEKRVREIREKLTQFLMRGWSPQREAAWTIRALNDLLSHLDALARENAALRELHRHIMLHGDCDHKCATANALEKSAGLDRENLVQAPAPSGDGVDRKP